MWGGGDAGHDLGGVLILPGGLVVVLPAVVDGAEVAVGGTEKQVRFQGGDELGFGADQVVLIEKLGAAGVAFAGGFGVAAGVDGDGLIGSNRRGRLVGAAMAAGGEDYSQQ